MAYIEGESFTTQIYHTTSGCFLFHVGKRKVVCFPNFNFTSRITFYSISGTLKC